MTPHVALLLLARGAGCGLALFGAVVAALGGASVTLLVVFWAIGLAIAVGQEWVRTLRGGAR